MPDPYYPDSSPVPLSHPDHKHSSHMLGITLFIAIVFIGSLIFYGVSQTNEIKTVSQGTPEPQPAPVQVTDSPELNEESKQAKERRIELDVCGNNKCEFGEDHASCPADCTKQAECGDTVCESEEQDLASPLYCAADCTEDEVPAESAAEQIQESKKKRIELGVCGNEICEPHEDTATCAEDCT